MKLVQSVRRTVGVLTVPAAVLLASGMVWQASQAAFSDTTRNSGDSWATGTVVLADDDAGSARFQATNLRPGATETRCITVTSSASLAGQVRLFAVNAVTSPSGLEQHILMTVDEGTGGSFGSCTGFTAAATDVTATSLATIASTHTDFATGLGTWSPTGTPPESRTYRFTWAFDTTGMTQTQVDALQGAHTGIDFEWEIQNT